MDRVLAKKIIATVTYYDVLDYPLTFFEVWKHLINSETEAQAEPVTLRDIRTCLNQKNVKKYIAQKNGFYFLHGRQALVDMRKEREVVSAQKIKRLQRIVSFMRLAPFVRMICVTGRLAYRNCEENSDLDVLIAYKEGHMWTGRFFLTLLTHITGVRRHGDKVCDRICLNYHMTTTSLAVPTRDLFAAHEYSFIYPLFDHGDYFEKFCKENMWIRSYKPHYGWSHKEHVRTHHDSRFTSLCRTFFEVILADRAMEERLRKMQKAKIQKNAMTYLEGALIIYNDRHLVFLPKPHGPEVFEEYKRRLAALECDL